MISQVEDFDSIGDCVIENNILKNRRKVPNVYYNLGKLILDTLNSKPEHVAQIEAKTGKESTFAELKDRSIRCAVWMKKQGIGCGDIVANCTGNHLNTIIPYLATYYNGAVLSPWFTEMSLDTIKYLVSLFRPGVIFCDKSDADSFAEAIKSQNVDTKIVVFAKCKNFYSFDDIINLPSDKEVQTFEIQEIESPENAVGTILLSSGSTNLPKGVMISYRNTLYKSIYGYIHHSNDVMLWCLQPYWASGTSLIIQCILTLTTRIILPEFDPEEVCKAIQKYKVQRCFFSGLAPTRLCKSKLLKKYRFESLKYIYTTGTKVHECIFEELKKDLPNVTILTAMGMAEGGGLLLRTKYSSINATGFLYPGGQLKVINVDTGKTLGPNESGELCFKTPTIMLGYYKNPESTRKTIDEEGWLHSDDYGYYNDKGDVFVIDRINYLFKTCNGYISPTEIEGVLLSHPDIIVAAVVPGFHEDEGEQRIMAFVEKNLNSIVTEEELIKLLSTSNRSIPFKVGIKFINEMPLLHQAKISKKVLKDMLEGNNENFKNQ